jgi:hypothetical protein
MTEDEMRDLLHQAAEALADPAAIHAYNLGIQIRRQLESPPPEPIVTDDEPMRA